MTSASCDRQVKLEATSGSVARRPRPCPSRPPERRTRKLSKSHQKEREQSRTGTAGPPHPGPTAKRRRKYVKRMVISPGALDEGLPRVGG